MVIYSAISENSTNVTNEALHQRTWQAVKAKVPEGQFQRLCCLGEKRQTRFDDPDKFVSIFPLFEIKIGYIWLIKALSLLITPIDAILWISFLGSAAIAVAGALAFSNLPGFFRFLWLPSLLLLGLPSLARFSTPDALATALYAISALCLHKRWFHATAVLILLGLAVRPDNVITCIGFATYFAIQGSKKYAMVVATVSVFIYVIITRSFEHVGWWNHFYWTLVENQASLTDFQVSFSITLYLSTLINNIGSVVTSNTWGAISLLCLCIAIGAPRSFRLTQISGERQFIFLMLASTVLHFFVFPFSGDRIYGPSLYPVILFMPTLLASRLAHAGAKHEPG